MRWFLVACEEFDARFNDLWLLLSRESVYSGEFDRKFEVAATRGGAEQFDDLFLQQVRGWRERLATDIHRNTPGLTSRELTYVVQLFLSRIIFLRICEDREIERYETLRGLDGDATFDALMEQLRRADAFYDSGLFRLIDDARLGVRIMTQRWNDFSGAFTTGQSLYFRGREPEVSAKSTRVSSARSSRSRRHVEIVYTPECARAAGFIPTPRYELPT